MTTAPHMIVLGKSQYSAFLTASNYYMPTFTATRHPHACPTEPLGYQATTLIFHGAHDPDLECNIAHDGLALRNLAQAVSPGIQARQRLDAKVADKQVPQGRRMEEWSMPMQSWLHWAARRQGMHSV